MRLPLPCIPTHRIWKTTVNIPVLVMQPAQDFALSISMLQGAEAAVPNVSMHIIDQCSHWLPEVGGWVGGRQMGPTSMQS
jgi:pimeloyl-ACP methyl ester carboxylesterase